MGKGQERMRRRLSPTRNIEDKQFSNVVKIRIFGLYTCIIYIVEIIKVKSRLIIGKISGFHKKTR